MDFKVGSSLQQVLWGRNGLQDINCADDLWLKLGLVIATKV